MIFSFRFARVKEPFVSDYLVNYLLHCLIARDVWSFYFTWFQLGDAQFCSWHVGDLERHCGGLQMWGSMGCCPNMSHVVHLEREEPLNIWKKGNFSAKSKVHVFQDSEWFLTFFTFSTSFLLDFVDKLALVWWVLACIYILASGFSLFCLYASSVHSSSFNEIT